MPPARDKDRSDRYGCGKQRGGKARHGITPFDLLLLRPVTGSMRKHRLRMHRHRRL